MAEPIEPDAGPGALADPAVDSGGLDRAAVLELLREGEITVEGRLVDASNATLYCAVEHEGRAAQCVYKPVVGERPLWDFPDGTLAAREVAAYLVSEGMAGGATGSRPGTGGSDPAGGDVGIVPPTVLRDGPFGEGMVQLWIDVDVTVDVVALVRGDDPRLRRVALFDAVINNADRKGGHLLPGPSGRIYGIDHGVCFHDENKLRTVLWTWRGRKLARAERERLAGLRAGLDGPLGHDLSDLLTRAELRALCARVDRLLDGGRFPMPSEDWPPIPWPPF